MNIIQKAYMYRIESKVSVAHIFSFLKGVSWIPQKGSTSCCTPYSLTTGNTGSSISGVSQDTLVISIEVRFTI